MSYRFRCFTLFDIENTGVTSRRNTQSNDPNSRISQAKQCNYDTLIQIISLRSQPEIVSCPAQVPKHPKLASNSSLCWMFEFEVFHQDVFGPNLSYLLQDCSQVPMLLTTETPEVHSFLSTTFEPNIYFEELPND